MKQPWKYSAGFSRLWNEKPRSLWFVASRSKKNDYQSIAIGWDGYNQQLFLDINEVDVIRIGASFRRSLSFSFDFNFRYVWALFRGKVV